MAAAEAPERPRGADCPPLKPLPYYLGTRAFQKARVAAARARARRAGWSGVRILGYHRVSDDRDPFAVSPVLFRSHMESLLASDAEPVSLERALDLLEHPVDGRYACVTFDDGFRDVGENAVPVLRELGIPATVFLPTAVIDGSATYSWYRGRPPAAMTWEEVAAFADEGVLDFQAHSRTHPRLPALDDGLAEEEIAGSKRDLEQRLGRPVTSFCYPAGLYSERDARLVEAAGFRAGLTTRAGVNPGGAPMGELRRTMVVWAEARREFEAKLAGVLDRPPVLTEWLQRRRAGARGA